MSYTSEVLADSPLIYWPLNDSAGSTTAADSSGNGRTGTVVTSWNFNQTNRLSTDSVSGSTATGSGAVKSPVVAFGTNDIMVEIWLDVDTTKSYMPLSFGVNYLDLLLANGKIGFNTGSGEQYGCTITNGIHHIVALMPNGKSTTNGKIYVDGVLQTLAGTSGTAPSLASTYFQISGWTASGQLIPSGTYVDEVAVYGTELTAARVSAHYSAGVAGVITNRIVSRSSTYALTSATVNSALSRQSAAVLTNEQTITRTLSRQSAAILVNEQIIQRTLSRVSVQVLIPTASRYRGWGLEN